MEEAKIWFGVKSIICHKKNTIDYISYEERVVLFLANDFNNAIEQAAIEADAYCLNDDSVTNCNFYDAYKIFDDDEKIVQHTEVFSSLKKSTLNIQEFLDTYHS